METETTHRPCADCGHPVAVAPTDTSTPYCLLHAMRRRLLNDPTDRACDCRRTDCGECAPLVRTHAFDGVRSLPRGVQ